MPLWIPFCFFCYAFVYCVLVFPTSLEFIRHCLITVSIFSVVHYLTLSVASFLSLCTSSPTTSGRGFPLVALVPSWAVVTPSSSRCRVSLVLSCPGMVMRDCVSHTQSSSCLLSSSICAFLFLFLLLSLPFFLFS